MKLKTILSIIFCLIVLMGCSNEEVVIINSSESSVSEPVDNADSSSLADNADNNMDYNYPFIYNMHEHLEPVAAGKMVEAMEKADVSKIVIVGSPEATLYKNAKPGFHGYDKNNDEILGLAEDYAQIIPYCTMWPLDGTKLTKYEECANKGSMGLKLYSGHSVLFYESPLNLTDMYGVYSYMEENDIPILFHVNPGKFDMQEEFEVVLNDFPDLRVICPHFCLSSIKTERMEYLMDKYPNLYTDISFGFYVEDGLKRISRNTSKYKALIEKYQDRTFFGTDMVVTSAKYKTVDWIYNLTMCYRNMLENEKYHCRVGDMLDLELNGLNLDDSVIYNIYYDSPRKFLKED